MLKDLFIFFAASVEDDRSSHCLHQRGRGWGASADPPTSLRGTAVSAGSDTNAAQERALLIMIRLPLRPQLVTSQIFSSEGGDRGCFPAPLSLGLPHANSCVDTLAAKRSLSL